MDTAPNARIFDEKGKAVAYTYVGAGDSLKILFKATQESKFIDFSPHNLHVWLNGQPLKMLQRLELILNPMDVPPRATITFALTDIDIDADTLTALQAIVKTKEAEENGERVTEAN